MRGGSVMRGGGSFGAGGTGLSGHSNQRFGQTSFREDFTIPHTTINLRLVHDKNRVLGLDAAPIPGRQGPTATPVPAPVGDDEPFMPITPIL